MKNIMIISDTMYGYRIKDSITKKKVQYDNIHDKDIAIKMHRDRFGLQNVQLDIITLIGENTDILAGIIK